MIRTAERPPAEGVRAGGRGGLALRGAANEDGMPTLAGYFARFNEWAEINSMIEGNFLEKIAPRAFSETIANDRGRMRVLFQHGVDPQVGEKVVGPILTLREDAAGAAYEVPLLDTSYNRDLLPGLEAGLYGASFRFRVVLEQWEASPGISPHNPKGLPERTLQAVQVPEFGPVTFPAYGGASAGVRSLSDWYLRSRESVGAVT